MAGILRQDKDFWNWVKGKNFISLCETWLEEKGWEVFKDRLPNSHWWAYGPAKREKKKGRAKGGFLIGRRGKIGGKKLAY